MLRLVEPQHTRRVNPVLYSHEFIPGFSTASPNSSNDYFAKKYAFYYRPEHGLPVQFDNIRGNIYSSAGLVLQTGQTATVELCRHGGQGNSDWRIVVLD